MHNARPTAMATRPGYQGRSGSGQQGCSVPAPGTDRTVMRYADGADTDSNCGDFMIACDATPAATNQAAPLPAPQN